VASLIKLNSDKGFAKFHCRNNRIQII